MKKLFLVLLLLVPGLLLAQFPYGHGNYIITTSDTVNIDKTSNYFYYYSTDGKLYFSKGGHLFQVASSGAGFAGDLEVSGKAVIEDSIGVRGTSEFKGEATFGATATPVTISTTGKVTAADTVVSEMCLKTPILEIDSIGQYQKIFKYSPPDTTNNPDFNMIINWTNQASDTDNVAFGMGFNLGTNALRENANYGASGFVWESYYENGANNIKEIYYKYIDPDGTEYRPFGCDYYETGNTVTFGLAASSISFMDKNRATQYLTISNGTYEMNNSMFFGGRSNNVVQFRQVNAANSAWISLPYVNANEDIVISTHDTINVGIGKTSNIGAKLHVSGAGGSAITGMFDGNKSTGNLLEWSNDNTYSAAGDSAGYVDSEGNLHIHGTGSFGSWGYTGEHVVIGESSSNTNAGLGVYSMVNYNPTAGKVFAGAYNRALAMTTNQTNLATIVGTESQFRLRDVNIGNGVHAGLWAYAEQSGTSVLSGGGTFDAISATVESEAGFSVGATEHVTGLTLDSSINGSATINASANFTGLYIKSNGKDWFNGIWTTGCGNDWKLRNGATIDNTSADLLTITESAIALAGHVRRSVTAGITAVNPGAQGDGALTSDINEVSVCGATNDAVTLPTAVAGLEIMIINNGAETLEIFPASSDNLGAGVNIATTLIAGANITFVAYDATNWEIK